jgi:3-methyladenine DNA glycosylase AlkD
MKREATSICAKQFLKELSSLHSPKLNNARFFTEANTSTKFLNTPMAQTFALAKQFISLSPIEIEILLESEYYEARLGAVSIMDFQARSKKTSEGQKKALYQLYLRRHDRINNWDLVDRSAPYVIGGYLFDKSRAPLYKLAKSKNVWERRTAIVSTYFFIRQNEIEDTFQLAEMLANDKHEAIHKAVGSWVREAGKRDNQMLLNFIEKHLPVMPRVMLRYATEKLDKKTRNSYLKAVG